MERPPDPASEPARRRRVLLGQLVANGDCLFATTVARQIKTDDPNCHLTWAISSRCRQVLRNNPHVDEVWEFELERHGELVEHWTDAKQLWENLKRTAHARRERGEFDEVYLTQFDYARVEDYDGTIRSLILGGYPRPITVPVNPVIRLGAEEVANVEQFVAAHPAVGRCAHVLLFECAPKSGQSFVTPAYALEVSRALTARRADVCVFLSSNLPVDTGEERIIDASRLSFRENAELTKHCTLLVGCSSGISWLGTSDWAKPLPYVQLLRGNAHLPNSFLHDHERRGLPTDGLLEMVDCPAPRLVDCLLAIFDQGFPAARARFHERISLKRTYADMLDVLLGQKRYAAAVRFVFNNLRRDWPARGLVVYPVWTAARHFVRAARHGWTRPAAR